MHPIMDRLEPRQLLAASFADGVVRIDGTKFNDDIRVWEYQSGEKLAVRFGSRGKIITFNLKVVDEIVVESGRGDDRIAVEFGGVPVSVYGGRGNDIITGPPGGHLLDGGLDDDAITGGSGDDTLIGGRGNDELNGSVGADLMLGGAGMDTVLTNSDEDQIFSAEQIQAIDRWVEIDAHAEMINRMRFLQNAQSATALVDFVFGSTGFMITSLDASRHGNQIRIEVGIAQWVGATHPAITEVQRRVPLGNLPAGEYSVSIVAKTGDVLRTATLVRQ